MGFLKKKKKKSHNDRIPGGDICIQVGGAEEAGKGWQGMTHFVE